MTLTLALREASDRADPAVRAGARGALDRLSQSDGIRESVAVMSDLADDEFKTLWTIRTQVGPNIVDLLRGALQSEGESIKRRRASEIIVNFGAPAIPRLAPIVDDAKWFTQRNVADVLGRIASPEAIPLLQALLRKADARVIGTVIGALGGIEDPAAARAIQTVLRTASGDARKAVVSALVAERHPRVVPMLVRILDESDPVKDHATVIDTINALGLVGSDPVIPPIVTVMGKRSWLARAKMRAVKEASVAALLKLGSAAALAALDHAGKRGDRQLRKVVRRLRT